MYPRKGCPAEGCGCLQGSPEEDGEHCTRREMWMGCFGEAQGKSGCSGWMGRGVRCVCTGCILGCTLRERGALVGFV